MKEGIMAKFGIALVLLVVFLVPPMPVLGQPHQSGHSGGKLPGQAVIKGRDVPANKESPGRNGNQEADESGTITLDELLREAAARNPAIMAAGEAARASKSLIIPARTLPQPTIMFEQMGELAPPELMPGDPSSARTYGFEQEIPFPGKLGLKGSIATAEAETLEVNHELVSRRITSELKQAYYDLFLADKLDEIIRRNKGLLQHFEEISESRYQVGQGIQQDVFKAQLEISRLIDRLVINDQRRAIAEAQINRLLYRPMETRVGKPAGYQKAEFRHTLDQLTEMVRKDAPELRMREKEIERGEYSVRLAEREYYPDFALGYNYFERKDQEEMHRVMISASLPLYYPFQQRPMLQSARSDLASARYMREETISEVDFQIREAYVMAATSDDLIRLYSKATIPQARLAMESAIASYQVGKVDFLTVIDSVTAVLEYEMKYYESLTEFQKALARMEPIVGMELTGVKE